LKALAWDTERDGPTYPAVDRELEKMFSGGYASHSLYKAGRFLPLAVAPVSLPRFTPSGHEILGV